MGVSRWFIGWLLLRLLELAKTVRSLVGAVIDLVDLKLSFHMTKKPGTFAFLVHPRSSEFHHDDVYGANDIFRPFPALRWLTYLLKPERADAWILWFAKWINPIRLSRITVRTPGKTFRGYLLSTVRTPEQLFRGGKDTRNHLSDLFSLAGSKRVERVGLGALLPSVSQNKSDRWFRVSLPPRNNCSGVRTVDSKYPRNVFPGVRTVIRERRIGLIHFANHKIHASALSGFSRYVSHRSAGNGRKMSFAPYTSSWWNSELRGCTRNANVPGFFVM
jgi:hypothetical protein